MATRENKQVRQEPMATRQHRLGAFTTEGEPPTRQPVEVLCEEKSGTYVPPFCCQWE